MNEARPLPTVSTTAAKSDIALNCRFTGQPMTGVQRASYELGRRLLRVRDDVSAIAPALPLPDYAHLPVTVRGTIGRFGGHYWEQTELRRVAAEHRVLLNLGGTGPVGPRNQVVMIHDVNYLLGPNGYTRAFRNGYAVLQRTLARTTAVCTVSEWSAQTIGKAFGVDPARFTVIPNAADHFRDISPDREAPSRYGIGRRPYVFCVGSANPNKNFASVIAAFEGMDDPEFDLVIAGGTDPRIFPAQRAAAHHPAIHRLPRISDPELRAILEGAALFVLPSFLEGFGIPAIEAMAAGVPVAAARAAALPEVCGDAALYFDPHDPGELAGVMRTMMSDPSLAADLTAKGRARESLYSWDRSVARLSNLLDAALSTSR